MKWKICSMCNNIISEKQNECPFCGFNPNDDFKKEKQIDPEQEIKIKKILKNTLKQTNISSSLKQTIIKDIKTMQIYDENDLNREITKIKLIEYVEDLDYGYVYRRDLIEMIRENKILDKKDLNKGLARIKARYAVTNSTHSSSKSQNTKYPHSSHGIGSYGRHTSYQRGWER